jgi:hypothetical protein
LLGITCKEDAQMGRERSWYAGKDGIFAGDTKIKRIRIPYHRYGVRREDGSNTLNNQALGKFF